MKKLLKNAIKNFIRGFLTLLPMMVTGYALIIFFNLSTNILDTVLVFIPREYRNNEFVIYAVELVSGIAAFILITFLGIYVKTLFGKTIISSIDKFFSSIPGLRTIYKVTRQVIDLLTLKENSFLKQPVLVEFPSPGIWSLGFNTGMVPQKLSPNQDGMFFTVVVPTTPNPTTGFLIVVSEEKIKPLSIPIETAFKCILTGGMIKG